MIDKVLHMLHIKLPKASRNIAMKKFGVILKILYHRYENAISIPHTLKLHYFD